MTRGVLTLCAGLLVGLLGCADRVDVLVEVPEAYGEEVRSLVLHILEPPASAPFDCVDLSFDDVNAAAIELSESSRVTLAEPGSEGELQLDRDASKLLWVEALDGSGLTVLHGCESLGNVDGDARIEVPLQPAAVFDVFAAGVTEEAQSFRVVTRDTHGDRLADRDILTRVVEPGGGVQESMLLSDADGAATASIPAATTAGPRIIEVAPAWPRNTALQLRGFAVPEPTLIPTPGQVVESARGRVGPSGEPGIVVIIEVTCVGTGLPGWTVGASFWDPAAQESVTLFDTSNCFDLPVPAMSILALDAGRDRGVLLVYDDTLARRVWIDIWPQRNGSGDIELATATSLLVPDPGSDPAFAISAGACDGSDNSLMLLDDSGRSLGVYAAPVAPGGPSQRVTSPFDRPSRAYVSSLCVSDGLGSPRRSLFSFETALTAYVETDAEPCNYRWTTEAPTSVPVAAIGAGDEPLMVYSSVERGLYEFEGVAARWDMAACEPVAVVRDSIPGTPLATRGGDLDGDGQLDLVSLIAGVGFAEDGRRITTQFVWASLATEHKGERLAGVSTSLGIPSEKFEVYDANGDGVDDIALSSTNIVAIFLMGALP